MADPEAESQSPSVERLATAKCVSPPSNSMPLPSIDVWNKVFWKGTREHKLLALKDDQDYVWFPYDPAFSVVHSQKSKRVELSGEGTVASWVVVHRRYFDSVANEMPYIVATIKLDEGPQIFSNLVNIADVSTVVSQIFMLKLERDQKTIVLRFLLDLGQRLPHSRSNCRGEIRP
jgi:uncharacterized protein